jgi:hypothetical protein
VEEASEMQTQAAGVRIDLDPVSCQQDPRITARPDLFQRF